MLFASNCVAVLVMFTESTRPCVSDGRALSEIRPESAWCEANHLSGSRRSHTM